MKKRLNYKEIAETYEGIIDKQNMVIQSKELIIQGLKESAKELININNETKEKYKTMFRDFMIMAVTAIILAIGLILK